MKKKSSPRKIAEESQTSQSRDFEIGRRQLYILPTKLGWYYALILLALFGIAVKFDNQAAFVMLFILVGLGNSIMLATHNNVIGLKIFAGAPRPCFAGQACTAKVVVKNEGEKDRHSIYLSSGEFHELLDMQANESQRVEVTKLAPRRGLMKMDDINLSSQYPSGLFFCWSKRAEFSSEAVVYPEPKRLVPLNREASGSDEDGDQNHASNLQGDFAGLRNYQAGDRLRDVYWPALARSNQLITKEYDAPTQQDYVFRWHDLPDDLHDEDKLSQLCAWIVDARTEEQTYTLRLPGLSIGPDDTQSHYHECLSALAHFDVQADPRTNPEKTNDSFVKRIARWIFNGRASTATS
ncbi:MAG: DUF58 domain-containing protein [Pseudomonadota bacterium]